MEMLNGICQGFAFIVNVSMPKNGRFFRFIFPSMHIWQLYLTFTERFEVDRAPRQERVQSYLRSFFKLSKNSDCQDNSLIIYYA